MIGAAAEREEAGINIDRGTQLGVNVAASRDLHGFLKDWRMEELQEKMKSQMNLEVYKCRSGGAGNSNCGNVSRKLFQNPQKFAEIVECCPDFVEDLGVMLDAVNSTSVDIDSKKYKAFADDFRERFHESHMAWNWPSPTVHGLLVHDHEFIEFYPSAPGLWSEEGAEANHRSGLISWYWVKVSMDKFNLFEIS